MFPELSLKATRDLYALDAYLSVNAYAQRPPCGQCGQSVMGHSYHHTANGVICHSCLYGIRRYQSIAETQPVKVKKNRWDGYVRPVVRCSECGAPLGDARSRRCRRCENQHRANRSAVP